MSEREEMDWARYGTAVRELAQMVADDGYRPDMILSIARGGLFVAGSLGYALAVKNLYVMNVEYYTGVDERRDIPVVLPPYVDWVDLGDQRILLVADVADTGHTLALVRETALAQVAEVREAVLYQKPQSMVDCQYVWRHTDRWINFPWSTEPPVVDLEGAGTSVLDACLHRRRPRRTASGVDRGPVGRPLHGPLQLATHRQQPVLPAVGRHQLNPDR